MSKLFKAIIAALLLSTPLAARAADVTPMQYEAVLMDASRKVDVGGCTDVAVVNIPDIRFAYDSAALEPAAEAQMDDLARVLSDRRFVHDRFMLEGHADARGSDAYNLDLSKRRARTVRDALIRRGAAADRISTRRYGERRLLYPGNPTHAHNRRVAFVVLDFGAVASEASARADLGLSELSVQVRALPAGENVAYIADTGIYRFASGDAFFLCVAASRPGMLEISARSDGDGAFRPLGKWLVPAETLVRAPATGLLRIAGAARTETLRLKLSTCAAPGLDCGDGLAIAQLFESIVQGRAKAKPLPVAAQSPPRSECNRPGVICREITLRRK